MLILQIKIFMSKKINGKTIFFFANILLLSQCFLLDILLKYFLAILYFFKENKKKIGKSQIIICISNKFICIPNKFICILNKNKNKFDLISNKFIYILNKFICILNKNNNYLN